MTAPLDSLRALVAADDALRAELARQDDPDAFLETATAIGLRHGLTLHADDLAPLVAPDPLGLMLHEPPPLRCAGWPPPGWLPYRIGPDLDGSPTVDWADFAGVALDGGFQAAAVRAALERPINRLLRCRTGFDDFLRGPPEGLRMPDGLVFHMSRCGSTLVARLLAALPGSYAVNEPDVIDTLLRASLDAPEALRLAVLRAMLGALGRRQSARWFLKLSIWPTLNLPLFRQACPGVPWLFLHRDPAAVLASNMLQCAPELDAKITPPALFGLAEGAPVAREEHAAMALARLCEAALAEEGGLFVDHAELPAAFAGTILPHFGIDAAEADPALLEAIAGRHAKHPDRPYAPGTATIDPAIRAAADAHLAAIHARLKAVRG